MPAIILATQPGYVAHWLLNGDMTAAALSAFSMLLTWARVPWLAHDVLTMSASALAADCWGLACGTWLSWQERARAAKARLATTAAGASEAAARGGPWPPELAAFPASRHPDPSARGARHGSRDAAALVHGVV